MAQKRDNSAYAQKVALRREMLKSVDAPVIMETHGGTGRLFRACYAGVQEGCVFEKKPERVAFLAYQRPTWAVYEGNCILAIGEGAGAHLLVNVLDVDPWGDPWPVIGAFFESERPRPDKMFVVVNDGSRLGIKMGGAWSVATLHGMVEKYGNDLYAIYLEVCRELMQEKVVQASYRLDRFNGYYCGHSQMMTHYLAVLVRDSGVKPTSGTDYAR